MNKLDKATKMAHEVKALLEGADAIFGSSKVAGDLMKLSYIETLLCMAKENAESVVDLLESLVIEDFE